MVVVTRAGRSLTRVVVRRALTAVFTEVEFTSQNARNYYSLVWYILICLIGPPCYTYTAVLLVGFAKQIKCQEGTVFRLYITLNV